MARLGGDILLLGVGGKMGPALARMARRAADRAGSRRRVIGVSRFTSPGRKNWLEGWGIETIGGDLLDSSFVQSLPNADNVLYLVGRKFGANGDAAQTWALNAHLPGLIADRFSSSRVVALSSGNVYGFTPVNPGCGASEADDPDPQGEYAMSVLGRERVFEYFSRTRGTPTAIIRLNYATELRYGVLVDLALKVHRQEPVLLEMGYFNAIWQRDACEMILRSFEHADSPPLVLNVTGPERISCRETCERFGDMLERPVKFVGSESETALLSDARQAIERFGAPQATVQDMMAWIADWIRHGGETWDKPTRFEVRNGKF
jgi:nucleoside-diphosphate-sugar epimerase